MVIVIQEHFITLFPLAQNAMRGITRAFKLLIDLGCSNLEQ